MCVVFVPCECSTTNIHVESSPISHGVLVSVLVNLLYLFPTFLLLKALVIIIITINHIILLFTFQILNSFFTSNTIYYMIM